MRPTARPSRAELITRTDSQIEERIPMTLKSGKTSRGLRKSAGCQLGLLLVLAFAFPHQLFGQCSKTNSLNCAYVTDGSGGDIFAVDRTTGATTKIQSIKGNVTLGDIRVATDNMLYVTTNSSVLKLSESGSGLTHVFDATKAIPGPFTGIRFSSLGDAFVNTARGVFRIGPDTNGNHLVQITGSTFPAPVQVTDTACSNSAGGAAVWPTGDLLIACNTVVNGSPVYEVLRCPAINGVASGCTGQSSLIQQVLTTSSPITGLAVDALARIFVASGNTVTQFDCTAGPCGPPSTLGTFATDFPAYIDVAPFPPGFAPSRAGGSPPCNSAAVTVFVSTGDVSSKNGKVWTINTVSTSATLHPPACDSLPTPAVETLAMVSSTRPAIGMGIASASRTLTKLLPNPATGVPSEIFANGPFSIQITNLTVNPGCNLSLTAEREAAGSLDAILAKARDANNNLVPSRAIPFSGEQSWRTTFHGGFPASGCTTSGDSHIGIVGALQYVNPWIALIDDATGKATLDPIPSVYPGFPLEGVPGDPIKIANSGLFTTNARIVLVDRGFTANGGQGYQFAGFEPPLVDPGGPSNNIEHSGKSFVLKFQLQANGAPISDAQGFAVTTGVSAARLTCDSSAGSACQNIQEMLINPEGNSATPPSFNYVGGGEFHFNLDSNQLDGTEWCNGIYEATANSDSFSPHTLQFELVGAPPAPQCF